MATLSDIGTTVAVRNLRRPDLQSDCVVLARDAYLSICGKVPFDELCEVTAERSMSTTDASHSLADIDPPINGIISIRATYGTNRYTRMKRSHARVFDAENQSLTGRPARYARFGNAIEFDRLADDDSYTYRIRYWTAPTISQNIGDTTLVIPETWNELVRYETLYRAYIELVDEPEKALMLMQGAMIPRGPTPTKVRSVEMGMIPRLWNDLLRTVSQREGIDEEFSIQPLRGY